MSRNARIKSVEQLAGLSRNALESKIKEQETKASWQAAEHNLPILRAALAALGEAAPAVSVPETRGQALAALAVGDDEKIYQAQRRRLLTVSEAMNRDL